MRCPACNTHNPPTATACSSCKGPLTPRRARRKDPTESVSPQTEEYNRRARGIFGLCLVSMVPFLGLVLGPVGALRAWRLIKQAKADPAFQAERAAYASVLLGAITGVSNWLGLGLILAGLLTS